MEDPRGKLLHDKKEASGRFSFTAKEEGDYKACFTATGALHFLHPECKRMVISKYLLQIFRFCAENNKLLSFSS